MPVGGNHPCSRPCGVVLTKCYTDALPAQVRDILMHRGMVYSRGCLALERVQDGDHGSFLILLRWRRRKLAAVGPNVGLKPIGAQGLATCKAQTLPSFEFDRYAYILLDTTHCGYIGVPC